jgi:hypothetical protein
MASAHEVAPSYLPSAAKKPHGAGFRVTTEVASTQTGFREARPKSCPTSSGRARLQPCRKQIISRASAPEVVASYLPSAAKAASSVIPRGTTKVVPYPTQSCPTQPSRALPNPVLPYTNQPCIHKSVVRWELGVIAQKKRKELLTGLVLTVAEGGAQHEVQKRQENDKCEARDKIDARIPPGLGNGG